MLESASSVVEVLAHRGQVALGMRRVAVVFDGLTIGIGDVGDLGFFGVIGDVVGHVVAQWMAISRGAGRRDSASATNHVNRLAGRDGPHTSQAGVDCTVQQRIQPSVRRYGRLDDWSSDGSPYTKRPVDTRVARTCTPIQTVSHLSARRETLALRRNKNKSPPSTPLSTHDDETHPP